MLNKQKVHEFFMSVVFSIHFFFGWWNWGGYKKRDCFNVEVFNKCTAEKQIPFSSENLPL